MLELEFYIKKLQDLEYYGEWKDIVTHNYQEIYTLINESNFRKRTLYLKDLENYKEELLELPYTPNSEEKLKFRRIQKHIIDLLYQIMTENKKVFIVQGEDSSMNDKVSAFLARLHIDFVSVDTQKTRKFKEFKKHTKGCDYAIILFSADDAGRRINSRLSEKARASQHVIFQTGYFLSQVGRKNLALLYSPDQEIESPFDFDDLAFAPLDHQGKWKDFLISHMQGTGMYIENTLLS